MRLGRPIQASLMRGAQSRTCIENPVSAMGIISLPNALLISVLIVCAVAGSNRWSGLHWTKCRLMISGTERCTKSVKVLLSCAEFLPRRLAWTSMANRPSPVARSQIWRMDLRNARRCSLRSCWRIWGTISGTSILRAGTSTSSSSCGPLYTDLMRQSECIGSAGAVYQDWNFPGMCSVSIQAASCFLWSSSVKALACILTGFVSSSFFLYMACGKS